MENLYYINCGVWDEKLARIARLTLSPSLPKRSSSSTEAQNRDKILGALSVQVLVLQLDLIVKQVTAGERRETA